MTGVSRPQRVGRAAGVRPVLLYDVAEMRTDHLRSLLADTLDPDPRSHPRPEEHLAAVLVPIVEDVEDQDPWVVFTRRTDELPRHADEIAEVLQYPLVRLVDAEREVELPRGDHVYRGFAYDMQDNTIWGATAFILHSLIEIVRKEQS